LKSKKVKLAVPTIMLERQREGIAKAKREGRYKGRMICLQDCGRTRRSDDTGPVRRSGDALNASGWRQSRRLILPMLLRYRPGVITLIL
jgi:hypothetical protein